MFERILTAAAALAIATAGLASAESEAQVPGDAHKFEKAAEYYAQCEGASGADFENVRDDVSAFTDMTIMAKTMMDPVKLFHLANVVNDPRTIHVMANCATEPVMWDTWMRNGTDPAKWMEASATMMNPAGWMAWMMAPANPEVWKEIAAHGDLDKYQRWITAFGNADFYRPVTDMVTAEWYEPRIAWAMDPESYGPFTSWMTPWTSN